MFQGKGKLGMTTGLKSKLPSRRPTETLRSCSSSVADTQGLYRVQHEHASFLPDAQSGPYLLGVSVNHVKRNWIRVPALSSSPLLVISPIKARCQDMLNSISQ